MSNIPNSPCFVVDEYTAVFIDQNPYWVATLSSGDVVYQDDNRPNMEPSAWLRLREYCYAEDLNVSSLMLQFAGYQFHAYDGSGDGVYFSLGSSALLGEDLRTWSLYVVGKILSKHMDVVKYEIPTLQEQIRDGRLISPKNIPSIIYHSHVRQNVRVTNDWTDDHPGSVFGGEGVHPENAEAPQGPAV